MRFAELLRLTTLLSAGAATALASACVIATVREPGSIVALEAAVWWAVAAIIGGRIGGRGEPSAAIATALADARPATSLPEPRPWTTIANRLWPLGVTVLGAGSVAFLAPPVPGIAAGFAIIWALSWRHQPAAVVAVEERDGVVFYVESTAAWAAVKLVRVAGLRREVPAATR